MFSVKFQSILLLVAILLSVDSFLHTNRISSLNRVSRNAVESERDFENNFIMKHLGDYESKERTRPTESDVEFNLNMGRAMEVLRRELPMAFQMTNLDFSIFANQITVCAGDGSNKISMAKPLYTAAVKSLRVASTISFTQPCINVMKIEYVEDSRTIQCRIEMVFPDTVRVDGQSTWAGMFYFGLDNTGMIETHIFDRTITTMGKNPFASVLAYPWIKNAAAPWSKDLIQGAPVPQYAAEGDNSN